MKDKIYFPITGIIMLLLGVFCSLVLIWFVAGIHVLMNTLIIIIIVVSLFVLQLIHNQNLIKNSRDNDAFQDYTKRHTYIPISVTLDPEGKGIRYPLFSYLVSIIKKKQNDTRFICLMGDTGTGKTDAMVYLHKNYINTKWKTKWTGGIHLSMPSQIRLYTMNVGYENLLKRIKEDYPQNKDRKECILLLDALDECKEARESLVSTDENNPSLFMHKLAKDTEDFAWVIVTCRKQFFMQEEYLPGAVPVEVDNLKEPDPFLHWQKLYIAPFSYEQVNEYLSLKFNTPDNEEFCKEASRIVFTNNGVFLRPLILSYIDILISIYGKRKEPLSIKEIYDAIVYFGIQQDAKNKPEEIDRLLNISIATAGYMYKHNLNCLHEEHVKMFCKEYKIYDSNDLLRIKTLLCNGKDGFKFSHKSFYDYLLAYWLFLHPEDIDSVLGLNFTLEIYMGIYEAYGSKGENSEMEQRLKTKEITSAVVATGLHNLAKGLSDLNQFKSSESLYQITLAIYRSLAEKSPDTFLLNLAKEQNSLANLHRSTNHPEKAKAEYQEALAIYRLLAEKTPDTFLPYVATSLNNLAILHDKAEDFKEAEARYKEALAIYRQLGEKDPNNYLSDLAMTLNYLAILHRNTNCIEVAEKEYQEALDIRRQLTESMNTDDTDKIIINEVKNKLFGTAQHLGKDVLKESIKSLHSILKCTECSLWSINHNSTREEREFVSTSLIFRELSTSYSPKNAIDFVHDVNKNLIHEIVKLDTNNRHLVFRYTKDLALEYGLRSHDFIMNLELNDFIVFPIFDEKKNITIALLEIFYKNRVFFDRTLDILSEIVLPFFSAAFNRDILVQKQNLMESLIGTHLEHKNDEVSILFKNIIFKVFFDVCPAQGSSFFLWDTYQNRYNLIATTGLMDNPEDIEVFYQKGEGRTGRIGQTGKPRITDDITQEDNNNQTRGKYRETLVEDAKTEMFIPIQDPSDENNVIGIFRLVNKKNAYNNNYIDFFNDADVDMMMYATKFLALIIANYQKEEAHYNFIDKLTHEIKTPANAIWKTAYRLYTHLTDYEFNNKYLSSYLKNIIDFAELQMWQASTNLYLSRNRRKQPFDVRYSIRPTILFNVIKKSIDIVIPIARKYNVKFDNIVINPQSDKRLTIKIDENAFMMIFYNLFTNAIKYHDPENDREQFYISISYVMESNFLVIKVADNGIGIKYDEKDAIFENGYRSGSAIRINAAGYGIGLTVIKQIVKDFGGEISITQLKKPTVFQIKLPKKKLYY